MSQHFPKPQRTFGGNVKVELDFSSYTTKGDLKKKRELTHLNWLENLI